MLMNINLTSTKKTLFYCHLFVEDVIQNVSFCFRIFRFHFSFFFFSGKRKRESIVLRYKKQLEKFFVYVRERNPQ